MFVPSPYRGWLLNRVVGIELKMWALFGGFLIHFILCNWLTVLLKPQYEAPIETAQDIVDRGIIPFVWNGGDGLKRFLEASPNPLYQQLGNITVVPKSRVPEGIYKNLQDKLIRKGILDDRTHVYLGNVNYMIWYWGLHGNFYQSRDSLEGDNPLGGNVINKAYSLADEYRHHIWLFNQVGEQRCY